MESSVTTKIKGVTKSQLDPGSEFDPGELQKTIDNCHKFLKGNSGII